MRLLGSCLVVLANGAHSLEMMASSYLVDDYIVSRSLSNILAFLNKLLTSWSPYLEPNFGVNRINGIIDGVECHYVALLVGLVIVGEIVWIKNHIVSLGHIPHLVID